MNVLPTAIVLQSVENTNTKSKKYSANPNEIEQKLLPSEKFP